VTLDATKVATGYILTEPLAVSAPRPAWQAAFEFGLLLVTAVLVGALAGDVLASANSAGIFHFPVVAGLVLGVVCADFASGALHWFCDRFFEADTPLLGPMLIVPFREHHDDPQGIVRHGLLELHGNSCIPIIALLLLGRALPATPLLQSWVLFFSLAALATNQFHRWAHDPAPAAPVCWLQRHGLILSPEGHDRHHRGEFQKSFCMTTGWLNPPLDRLDFFPRAERALRALRPARSAKD